MIDESHLPVSQQSLVFRLRKRAEIRRQIPGRKSVEEGARDRIADLLEESANEIEKLQAYQSNRKPLTDEEIYLTINQIDRGERGWSIRFARAIESAHGIK